jgi:hypothetical protein
MLLTVRARGLGMAGRGEEGLAPVDEAIELMQDRDNVLYPQLPLVKGDLLIDAPRRGDAADWFRHAYDSAEAVGARMWQLRAASRLAELRRAVVDTFSETSDTPDLVEARAILESEASSEGPV